MSRIPLWVMVLPLAFGVLIYWLYWRGEAADFRVRVERALPEAGPVEMGGFPYRIEARLPKLSLRRDRADSFAALSARRVEIDRQPWLDRHVVIAAQSPKLQLTLPGIAKARLDVEAPGGLASIRRSDGVLQRLSMHFERAKLWLPIVGGPFAAEDFEIHLRETPGETVGGNSPGLPVQAQVRLGGLLSSAGGARFRIEVPVDLTAATRIRSVAGWRDGGAAEIRGARLLTAGGTALAGMDATIALLPDGRLAVSGTVATDCPATVRALFGGKPPGLEFRARRTRKLALSGFAGDLELSAPEGASGGPVRSRAPPCPDLRR